MRAATRRIELEERIAGLVRSARRNGASWALIGDALGTSRQAAHDRYARLVDETADSGLTEAERTYVAVHGR